MTLRWLICLGLKRLFRIGIWGKTIRLKGSKFKDHFVIAILALSCVALIGLFILLLRHKKQNYQVGGIVQNHFNISQCPFPIPAI